MERLYIYLHVNIFFLIVVVDRILLQWHIACIRWWIQFSQQRNLLQFPFTLLYVEKRHKHTQAHKRRSNDFQPAISTKMFFFLHCSALCCWCVCVDISSTTSLCLPTGAYNNFLFFVNVARFCVNHARDWIYGSHFTFRGWGKDKQQSDQNNFGERRATVMFFKL